MAHTAGKVGPTAPRHPDLSHDIGEVGRRRMREVFTIGHFNRRIRAAINPFAPTISQ